MVEVQGARELRKSLKAAGQSLDDLKAANRQAAEIAAKASAALAPRVTGRLSASVRAAGTNTAGIIRAGKKNVPYANAVHWGRRNWPNSKSPRRTRSVVRAQPFMSQGAKNSEGRWLPIYQQALDHSIELVKGL